MPRRIIDFDLDLNTQNMTTRFQCKDFEDIQVNAHIIEKGQPYDLSNCTVDFVSSLGIEELIGVVDNVVQFTFNSGSNFNKIAEGEIIINDANGTLKTPSFFFSITKSLSGEIIIAFYQLIDVEGYNLVDSEGYYLKVRG